VVVIVGHFGEAGDAGVDGRVRGVECHVRGFTIVGAGHGSERFLADEANPEISTEKVAKRGNMSLTCSLALSPAHIHPPPPILRTSHHPPDLARPALPKYPLARLLSAFESHLISR
jgi:hypothetical protein